MAVATACTDAGSTAAQAAEIMETSECVPRSHWIQRLRPILQSDAHSRNQERQCPAMNRVEKANKRKKYRFAKVYYKTGEGEDAVDALRDSSGRTPRQWGPLGLSQKPNDVARNSHRMGGYFEEQ